MESSSINLNIVRLKDQQCARLSVTTSNSLRSLAIELEKAGLVDNTANFNSWVFLNKYNDECYQITDEPISKYPIKNNGTLYILNAFVAPNTTTNFLAMEQELVKLRQENQSLRKAVELLSSHM